MIYVMTVKSAASGDGVQCTFVSDRSISKHRLYATLVNVVDVVYGSYFGVY